MMITARQIVLALHGQWHGRYGTCKCPAHDDHSPSLSVRQFPGRIAVKCFSGCDPRAVVAELRARGLWPARDEDGFSAKRSIALRASATIDKNGADIAKERAAREIWSHAHLVEPTNTAHAYLLARGCRVDHLPPTLRATEELYHREAKRSYPALIGAIQSGAGRIVAVQRTWVHQGKKAPVAPPKKTLGPMGDGAIRLGRAGRTLGIAEGIETGLSAQQRYQIPVWVACGAWRMGSILLPDIVQRIILFADNGTAGQEAAGKAADDFYAQGLDVEIETPPPEFDDWNSFAQASAA